MRHLLLVAIIITGLLKAEGQEYIEMMQNLYDASKVRKVTSARISYTEEREDGTKTYNQFEYGDNRENPWRVIHRIEENETLFYDGLYTTFYFYHDKMMYAIDTGMAALNVFKNKMGILSRILLARQGSGISGLVDNAVSDVIHEGNGGFSLVLSFPGQLEYNLTDKKSMVLMDSNQWVPLQYIDSVYFLEKLVRIEENIDTFYSSFHDADSIFNKVKLWTQSYTLYSSVEGDVEEITLFPYQEIFDNLEFINHEPPQVQYYLFDFYFAGCAPCHQCLPLVKSLETEYSELLAIIGINPTDKIEKIERYNRLNNITYPSATISKAFLDSIVGELGYPTFILYDGKKNEIARATDCDPAFFDHVAEIISGR